MTARRMQRLAQTLDRRQPDLTVLLDEVHKPHNMAAVVRTCDAVGVGEVHAVARQAFRVSRSPSAGVARWVRLRYHPAVEEAVLGLQSGGFQVLATHRSAHSRDFRAFDYTRPTAFLLGAEKQGVSAAAAACADGHVEIPQVGLAESLNVSVAAAVMLYEAQRQRSAAGLYDTPRIPADERERTLFEWLHPKIAARCRERGEPYPPLDEDGQPQRVP